MVEDSGDRQVPTSDRHDHTLRGASVVLSRFEQTICLLTNELREVESETHPQIVTDLIVGDIR